MVGAERSFSIIDLFEQGVRGAERSGGIPTAQAASALKGSPRERVELLR